MLIRLFSDLHTELAPYKFEPLETDNETICILAGDIGQGEAMDSWLPVVGNASQQFAYVIYVLGNHELYGGTYPTTLVKMCQVVKEMELDNVFILQDQTIVINNVAFIGSTLWTDFNKGNPIDMHAANHGMNDYRMIKILKEGEHVMKGEYTRRLLPSDVVVMHNTAKAYITAAALEHTARGNKIVLVVHHGVTNRSLNPYYADDPLNPAFVSELTEELIEINADLIVHGHVHWAHDYYIDQDQCKTRVVCNPRGYHGYEKKTGFEPLKVIEL